MPVKTSRQGIWRTRNVWGLSLASLFSDMGHELVTALMPAILTTLSAPVFALGFIEGISNLGQAWAGIWGGKQADSNVHRREILVLGYILTGLKAAMAVVTVWPWLILIRTVAWLGRGARGPIRNTFIAEDVAPEHLGKAYGFREAFDTAGAIAGPLAAALLTSLLGIRRLIAWSLLPAGLTVLAVLYWVRDPKPRLQREQQSRLSAAQAKMPLPGYFDRFLWAVGIFSAGFLAPTFFILRVWTSHQSFLGVSAQVAALLLYTVHNVVYAIGSFPAGAMVDKRGPKPLLMTGYVIWTWVLVGFAVDHASLGGWIVLFGGSGLATALLETSQKAWAARMLPGKVRGTGLGRMVATVGVGQLVANGVAGLLWAEASPSASFLAAALLAALGAVLMARFEPLRAVGQDR